VPLQFASRRPSVIFFERFRAPTFTEPTFNPSIFQGQRVPSAIRNQAQGDIGHTYGGLYLQDHWRATKNLALNYGLRYQFETFPSKVLSNQSAEFDPRAGFAYSFGTKYNIVLRGGGGVFHGIIPMPLLACQIPSCGGTAGPYPGRPQEDAANSTTRLFAFASAPNITSIALADLLGGTYPDAAPLGFCPVGRSLDAASLGIRSLPDSTRTIRRLTESRPAWAWNFNLSVTPSWTSVFCARKACILAASST